MIFAQYCLLLCVGLAFSVGAAFLAERLGPWVDEYYDRAYLRYLEREFGIPPGVYVFDLNTARRIRDRQNQTAP